MSFVGDNDPTNIDLSDVSISALLEMKGPYCGLLREVGDKHDIYNYINLVQ